MDIKGKLINYYNKIETWKYFHRAGKWRKYITHFVDEESVNILKVVELYRNRMYSEIFLRAMADASNAKYIVPELEQLNKKIILIGGGTICLFTPIITAYGLFISCSRIKLFKFAL